MGGLSLISAEILSRKNVVFPELFVLECVKNVLYFCFKFRVIITVYLIYLNAHQFFR